MEITASVCHDSLTATFTLPKDANLIAVEQIIKELQKDCYKHSLIDPFPEKEVRVLLDTVSQFSTFVSWLAENIAKNW